MMPRIIRARTPEEFYDTLRDAELSRALQAVADEMARIKPTTAACLDVQAYMAKPKRLRVVTR